MTQLHEEWGIQWDGEPKMGGGFHVCSVGTTWRTEQEARDAAQHASISRRPGFRLVHRMVSEWVREVFDKRPHSRACGLWEHPHGPRCHSNCPTCGQGREQFRGGK